MEFNNLKKEIPWFWKADPNGRKTQEKAKPEQKVLALNAGEKKRKNRNGKFFKGKCNKCGNYDHIA